jgi:hypothetical protein
MLQYEADRLTGLEQKFADLFIDAVVDLDPILTADDQPGAAPNGQES